MLSRGTQLKGRNRRGSRKSMGDRWREGSSQGGDGFGWSCEERGIRWYRVDWIDKMSVYSSVRFVRS